MISDSDDEHVEMLTQMLSQPFDDNESNSPQVISDDDDDDKTASENDDEDSLGKFDWESFLNETKPTMGAVNREGEETADDADNEDNCDVDDDVTSGVLASLDGAPKSYNNDLRQFMLSSRKHPEQNITESTGNSKEPRHLQGNEYTQFMLDDREEQVKDRKETTGSTTPMELPDLTPEEDSDDFSQSLLSGRARQENQPSCSYIERKRESDGYVDNAKGKQRNETIPQTFRAWQISQPAKSSESTRTCSFLLAASDAEYFSFTIQLPECTATCPHK